MTIGHVGSVPIEPRALISTPPIFKTLQQRVNAYDRAANGQPTFESGEKTFVDKFESSAMKWGGRVAAGLLVDRYVPLPENNSFTITVAQKLSRYTQNAKLYPQLLGIQHNLFEIGSGKDFDNYKALFCTKLGRDSWWAAIKLNFSDFLKENPCRGMTLKNFFSKTFLAQDIVGVQTACEQGLVGRALSRVAGLGLLAYSWFSKTQDAYRYAKAYEQKTPLSQLKTWGYTLLHGVLQALKLGITWEMGTVGAALFTAVIPLMGIPGVICGIFGGALLGTLSYKLMGLLIKDPPRMSKT